MIAASASTNAARGCGSSDPISRQTAASRSSEKSCESFGTFVGIYYKELKESYRRVRIFLPSLLQTVCFGATPAGQPVGIQRNAITYL
jgi:hypothetical protein